MFEVEPECGRGRTRIPHRNMLLPCDFLPVTTHGENTPTTTRTKRCNRDKNKQKHVTGQAQQMDSEDSDDDFPAVTFTCSPAEPRGPPSLNPTAEELYPQAKEAVPEGCEPHHVEDEQAHTAALDRRGCWCR